jgi:hypothetical protein
VAYRGGTAYRRICGRLTEGALPIGGSVGGLQIVCEWRVLEGKGRATAVHGYRSDQFSPKYVTQHVSSIYN